MRGEIHQYECEAVNVVRGIRHSISANVSFVASKFCIYFEDTLSLPFLISARRKNVYRKCAGIGSSRRLANLVGPKPV